MKQFILSHKQIVFFMVAGALSALIEISSFKLFSVELPKVFVQETNFKGISYPLSNLFSTTLGIVSNYFFSIWFVFTRGKHSKSREFLYFMAISVLTMLLSLLVFQLFYNFIYQNESFNLGFFTFSAEMLSKISAIILVSILNYSVKKRIVFKG
ncbi:GtrA family protein [Chryseobacterium sp. A321]